MEWMAVSAWRGDEAQTLLEASVNGEVKMKEKERRRRRKKESGCDSAESQQ